MCRTYLMSTVLGCVLLGVSPASAQPASSSPDAALRADSQSVVPGPGVRAPIVQPAAAPQVQTCGPAGIQGVHPAEAETAVWLVCEEIRRRPGLPAVISPAQPPPVYRVGLLRLGRIVLLTVHVEAPAGTIRDGRQLRLETIEEVPVAAPRLVDALWQGSPVTSTRRVSNLVGEETRAYEKQQGEFLYGGGLVGMHILGSEAGVQAGLDLRAGYESERFGIGLGFRFGGGDSYNRERSADYNSFNVGGRYFLSYGNTGVFVGGGLVWSSVDVSRDTMDSYEYKEGSGIGSYGEVGVELLRLHTSRLTFDLRFETPFYQLESHDYGGSFDGDASTDSGVGEPRSDDSAYVVPILAGLAYTF